MTLREPRPSRRFSALHARGGVRRLSLGFLLLVVALLVPSPARAAVPMCSTDGRSIAAPPIILPWRQLSLEAPKPCSQPDNQLLRAMPEQQQRTPSSPPAPAPLRAMPLRDSELPGPPSAREPLPVVTCPLGFDPSNVIYRPPRG